MKIIVLLAVIFTGSYAYQKQSLVSSQQSQISVVFDTQKQKQYFNRLFSTLDASPDFGSRYFQSMNIKILLAEIKKAYESGAPSNKVTSVLVDVLQDQKYLAEVLSDPFLLQKIAQDPLLNSKMKRVLAIGIANVISKFPEPIDKDGHITTEYKNMAQNLSKKVLPYFPELFIEASKNLDEAVFNKTGNLNSVEQVNREVANNFSPAQGMLKRAFKDWSRAEVRWISVKQTLKNTLNRAKVFFTGKTYIRQASTLINVRVSAVSSELSFSEYVISLNKSSIKALISKNLQSLIDDTVGLLSKAPVSALEERSTLKALIDQLGNFVNTILKSRESIAFYGKEHQYVNAVVLEIAEENFSSEKIKKMFFNKAIKQFDRAQLKALAQALFNNNVYDETDIDLNSQESDSLETLLDGDSSSERTKSEPVELTQQTGADHQNGYSDSTVTKKRTGLTEEEREQEEQNSERNNSGDQGEMSLEDDSEGNPGER